MVTLAFPEYKFNIRTKSDITQIFDITRNKFIKLTPEEWVRQNFLMYMISQLGYPKSLIITEKTLKYGKLTKKADIVIYDSSAKPRIIVECKAPSIKLSQDVFDQLARYNFSLNVDYLIISNGLEHYCCLMDYENQTYHFLEAIPSYASIL